MNISIYSHVSLAPRSSVQCTVKVTGYSLLINIHKKYYLFPVQDPGMHAFNLTTKKVALACNSSAGWVGRAGNLIAVRAVNSLCTKF